MTSTSYYLLKICLSKSNDMRDTYVKAAAAHNEKVDAYLKDNMSCYDSGFDLFCPDITYIGDNTCSCVVKKKWELIKNDALRDAVCENSKEKTDIANHAQDVCNAIRKAQLQLHREKNVERAWELDGRGFNLGVKVNHKIKCSMVKVSKNKNKNNTKIVGYYLYPRSSLGTKSTLRLSNSVGIIDSGYRGNIIAAFDNHGNDHVIDKGDRVVQICPPDLCHPIKVEIVDSEADLGNETARGSGGFGSTGK